MGKGVSLVHPAAAQHPGWGWGGMVVTGEAEEGAGGPDQAGRPVGAADIGFNLRP